MKKTSKRKKATRRRDPFFGIADWVATVIGHHDMKEIFMRLISHGATLAYINSSSKEEAEKLMQSAISLSWSDAKNFCEKLWKQPSEFSLDDKEGK